MCVGERVEGVCVYKGRGLKVCVCARGECEGVCGRWTPHIQYPMSLAPPTLCMADESYGSPLNGSFLASDKGELRHSSVSNIFLAVWLETDCWSLPPAGRALTV